MFIGGNNSFDGSESDCEGGFGSRVSMQSHNDDE